ncbi:SPOR domain-containing protein [Halomonas borealis]|uniref:SPOR domain-containing protein n=1 Tax=Halomonas borealis TaxID=2508710 RepID=UPI0010A0664F|nr:SPOR domain-containing protein [Halomonas borealis]
MKYGWRERISGALILLALAVIFLPLLFDDPAPREDRPRPTMTIEQPIEVPHREPEAPTPPDEVSSRDQASGGDETATLDTGQAVASRDAQDADGAGEGQETADAEPEPKPEPSPAPPAEEVETEVDPIADLARAADERMAAADEPTREAVSGGEWAVQVGSFGEPANAERLEARLADEGFPAYRRPRDDRLTTVYVGPYASSEVAERAMTELKADLNLQGLLVEAE